MKTERTRRRKLNAAKAVPQLKEAAENGDDELSESAEEAIERIVALDERRENHDARAELNSSPTERKSRTKKNKML